MTLTAALRSKAAYRAWLCAAILVAALGFWIGPGRFIFYATGNGMPNDASIISTNWVAGLWLIIFTFALLLYKVKALWFLLIAPFALYWPLMWLIYGHI
jgi:hypothetical protein